MTRPELFKYFFFGVFLFLLYQLILLLSPFFVAILGSAVLAFTFYPLHRWMVLQLPKSPSAAALLTTVIVVSATLLPLALAVVLLATETVKIYPFVSVWVRNFNAAQLPKFILFWWEGMSALLGSFDPQLKQLALNSLRQMTTVLTALGTQLAKNFLLIPFNVLILVFSLFFAFRDGQSIIGRIRGLLPMQERHKTLILARLNDTLSAIIRGILATAAVQGLLAAFGFWVAGVPFAAVLGLATAFFAVMPLGGAVLVWLPVALFQFSSENYGVATFIFIWGMFVVSTIDNFLKPILIGSKAKLPTFLLFFGILGGLVVYGPVGVLVGPTVVAIVLTFIKIYQEEYYKEILSVNE
ncbi:MAG: AI-2E family transporter [Elusimicrobia bacterium]|nr:AI-2E family transporter [Elusimicrobiota bacterium]